MRNLDGSIPFGPDSSHCASSCDVSPRLAWLWPVPRCPVLGFVRLWLCAGGLACCLLCGGLRDEDQYLLRHSSLALDQDSPCGQHMLLAHLEHQNKEQLQCTLARLENENRCASKTQQKGACCEFGATGFVPAGILELSKNRFCFPQERPVTTQVMFVSWGIMEFPACLWMCAEQNSFAL